jgi:hypothetical protein
MKNPGTSVSGFFTFDVKIRTELLIVNPLIVKVFYEENVYKFLCGKIIITRFRKLGVT